MRTIEGKVLQRKFTAAGDEVVNWAMIAGKSTETKPAEHLATGSMFIEIDTGDVYLFDEDAQAWLTSEGTSLNGATVTLGSSLTYTGAEQTQAVTSVVVGNDTLIEGTDYEVTRNKATNAGTYTLYIVGKGTYGGVTSKTFTIAKAQGSVAVDPASLSLTYGGAAKDSELTVVGDGAVTVTASTAGKVTTVLEDDVLTVTPVAPGSVTLTVTLAAGANYLGATATISVTVAKATGSVTADPDTMALVAGEEGTSEVTVVGDGNVTVASSDSTVATVTVSKAAGTNYKAASDTIAVTVTAAEEGEGNDT